MTDTIKPTILFKRPETIPATVTFPLPDGTEAKLACEFKYRTRKEFGALWDEIAQASLAEAGKADGDKKAAKGRKSSKDATADEAAPEEKFSFEGLMARGDEANAKNALRYLAAWPKELPTLNEANLNQVFDEAPAAASAIWATYRDLCTTGIAKN